MLPATGVMVAVKGKMMLKQRVTTAVIMLVFVLAVIFALPFPVFMLVSAAVFAIAAWEWGRFAGLTEAGQYLAGAVVFALLALYAIASGWQVNRLEVFIFASAAIWWLIATMLVFSYPLSKGVWRRIPVKLLMGYMVIIPCWFAIVSLIGQDKMLFFYLVVLVSGADIGAYFSGRAWGKSKLAPKVSPGKSWAGFWGGFAVSIFIAFVASLFNWFELGFVELLGLSILVMPASVIGDLLESMMKRECGIKDSSQLLPGHGGVMDRLDSLTAAAPLFCLYLKAAG